jgi:DNA gyrase subunit A
MGRATQGVKLINLKGSDSIAAVAKVMQDEDHVEDSERLEDTTNLEDGTTIDNPLDENSTEN